MHTLDQCVNYCINHPDLGIHLAERIKAKPELVWGRFEIETKQAVYVHRSDGTRHKLLAIRFDLSWTTSYSDVSLRSGALGSVAVTWGSANTPEGTLSFVSTEREREGTSATIRLSSADGKASQLGRMLAMAAYKPSRFNFVEVGPDEFL
jgi:hypothetical protein